MLIHLYQITKLLSLILLYLLYWLYICFFDIHHAYVVTSPVEFIVSEKMKRGGPLPVAILRPHLVQCHAHRLPGRRPYLYILAILFNSIRHFLTYHLPIYLIRKVVALQLKRPPSSSSSLSSSSSSSSSRFLTRSPL